MTTLQQIWRVSLWCVRFGVRCVLISVALISLIAMFIDRLWGGPR